MQTPQKVNEPMSCDVDIPCDRFWVRDDNGDDFQVRFEPDGSVYVCYTSENRRKIESRDVSWSDFVLAFRKFVDSL